MRILLRTDGELVTGAQPHLGYLHRCAEKIGENVEWLQYLPYTDRYDYLAAMNNNLGYSMAVEAVMGVEIPRRAEMLRIICAELNRIGSHLIAFGTYGLDLGASTCVVLLLSVAQTPEVEVHGSLCGEMVELVRGERAMIAVLDAGPYVQRGGETALERLPARVAGWRRALDPGGLTPVEVQLSASPHEEATPLNDLADRLLAGCSEPALLGLEAGGTS